MAWPLRASTLIGILALFLWGCLLSVGVMIYVRCGDSRQLALLVSQQLTAGTNCAWRIDRIDVEFSPRPHARLHDVTMQHSDMRLDVSEVSASLDWSNLLYLRFVPGRVVLDKPVLTVNRQLHSDASLDLPFPFSGKTVSISLQKLSDFLPASLPEPLHDMRLIVQHGYIGLQHSSFNAAIRNLNASVRLPGLFSGSLELDFSELTVSRQAQNMGRLSDFRLQAQGIRLPESDHARPHFKTGNLGGMLSLPGVCDHLELRLHLATNEDSDPLAGRLDLEGDLATVPPMPLRLHLPFALTGTREVRLQNAQLALDADAVTLNAALTPETWFDTLLIDRKSQSAPQVAHDATQSFPAPQSRPLHVKGTAQIRRLSLPRWFAFARKLPPGIETALNNVSGELDFVLTPHDLTIPRLKALICGIPFAGVGGVSDFAKPNIHIAVQADTADVNAIFPELLRQSPKAIDWPAPPLVQQNDSRAGPDYDIRIAVAKAKIWKFAATQLALRCTPLPKGNRLHVAAKGFYDGSFVSTVDIEDRVAITAAFNQTMLDKPAAIVIDDSMLGGRLTGKATLHGSNQSFDHFLASLDGTVQGHITQGWLAKPGGKEKTLFGVMDFTLKAIGPGLAPPLPPLLSFAGDWKVSLRTATWEGSCTLNGALDLDSASLAFRRAHNVPGRLQWSDNGLTVNLEAQWDFDQAKDTLHIRNASGKLNGGAFSGSLAGSGISAASPQSPQWQGSLHLTTTALRPILQQHGLLPPDMPEESLQYLDIRGDFDLTGKTFQALGLKGKLDDTTFSGNIRHSSGDIRTWQADLTLGTLDLNRYLPSRPNATPNATPNVGQSPAQNPAPWPTTLLDDLSVRGTINLDSLTLAKLVQRSVRLPFVLENRVLTCKPIAFIPYNGRGEAELHVQASPAGYRTRLHYAAHNADAALFSREAGFKTILGGVATVKADVAGLLRQGKDIPATLDGSWSVAVTQGSIVEKQSGGSAAKPTPFRSISASGVMHQGILHTQDIDLKSNVIAAKGNARINLVDWTLNCRLNVSTQSFSDVPVVYAGSLDAPERSINALHAVTGAIGKLGSGLYGLVEDVLSTPFRLLR